MSSNQERRPIGVFDSGFGGLTVVRELRRRLPNEPILYLGDTARLPYGTKSESTVIRYTRQIIHFFNRHKVKLLVAACNTASALGVPHLLGESQSPILGVVEPGAKLAVKRTRRGVIGVMGTMSTISSGAYQRALQQIDPRLLVCAQACPLLVPLVEEGWTQHPATFQIVRHYLGELGSACVGLDTIVLGCTHYPMLKNTIATVAEQVLGEPIHLIDSAEAIAAEVDETLHSGGLTCQERGDAEDRFYFTDVNQFERISACFLGETIAAEHVDIDSNTTPP